MNRYQAKEKAHYIAIYLAEHPVLRVAWRSLDPKEQRRLKSGMADIILAEEFAMDPDGKLLVVDGLGRVELLVERREAADD
jgi:hypothetical protein